MTMMKMCPDFPENCCVCFYGTTDCLEDHGYDNFVPAKQEQVIKRLDKGIFPRDREKMKKYLFNKFYFVYKEKKDKKNLVYNFRPLDKKIY